VKGHFATHVEEGRDAGVQIRLPSVERGGEVAGPSPSPSLFKFLQVHGHKVNREHRLGLMFQPLQRLLVSMIWLSTLAGTISFNPYTRISIASIAHTLFFSHPVCEAAQVLEHGPQRVLDRRPGNPLGK
jgi:hypothetical protein